TRNMVLGSASVISPSISIFSSFAICAGQGSAWRRCRRGFGSRLATLEGRLPRSLLEESGHGVLQVLGGEKLGEDVGGDAIGLLHAPRPLGANDPLGGPVGDRRTVGQPVRELHALLEQLIVRYNAADHVPALERGR